MNVKISSGTTGCGTRVTTADGATIDGLTEVVFRAVVNDLNRAELHLHVAGIEAEAEATVYVAGKEVRRIEYADGSVDEYPA